MRRLITIIETVRAHVPIHTCLLWQSTLFIELKQSKITLLILRKSGSADQGKPLEEF
jgi:hypothetical protein